MFVLCLVGISGAFNLSHRSHWSHLQSHLHPLALQYIFLAYATAYLLSIDRYYNSFIPAIRLANSEYLSNASSN